MYITYMCMLWMFSDLQPLSVNAQLMSNFKGAAFQEQETYTVNNQSIIAATNEQHLQWTYPNLNKTAPSNWKLLLFNAQQNIHEYTYFGHSDVCEDAGNWSSDKWFSTV